jgi:hypothetical protein
MTKARKSKKSDYSKIDIDAVLAERGQVAVIWSIEDVQTGRPDLSDAQAWEVLVRCRDEHSSEYGITWQYLEDVADGMFPNSPTTRRSHP